MASTSQGWGHDITLATAADLSGAQYAIVRVSAADTCNLASNAAAQDMVGVLQNKPAATGRAAQVRVLGETKVVAGAAITAGDLVTTNGSGRAAAATSGQMILGQAISTAANDGELLRVLLKPFFNGIVT